MGKQQHRGKGTAAGGVVTRVRKRPAQIQQKRTTRGLRPCTAAAAASQVCVDTPPFFSPSFPSWGAKVSRSSSTALGRRDWANLGGGPAGLIANRVLAEDVADYIRFRAVCRPLRQCSADPRAHGVLEDPRFHPRRWIVLLEDKELDDADAAPDCNRRQFLNVSTGCCIRVDIPELRDYGMLRSSADGLLILLGRTTDAVRLLNPLTRQVAELPPITGLLGYRPRYVGSCSTSGAGLIDGHTVLLHGGGEMLALAKPGDERWMLVKTDADLMPVMCFAGRFYGVTRYEVMMLDTSGGEDTPPRLVVAAEFDQPFSRMTDTMHLVDNGGELMLVHCMIRPTRATNRRYKLYRVDLDAGKMTPAASLRRRAFFTGLFRSLSVSPQVFPFINTDTIYLGVNCVERGGSEQIGAYRLRDGSIEHSNYQRRSGLAHPLSIADCLAAYVGG